MNKTKQVFENLYKIFSVTNDTELAKVLNVPRATLGSWKKRDSIPYEECINVAKSKNISLNWLLIGEGEMYRRSGTTPSIEDIPEWLREWWARADERERNWLEVELKRL